MSQITCSQGSRYTDVQRMEAAAHYVVFGNVTKVAEITGIPYHTISHWRHNMDWWALKTKEVRQEKSEELDAMLSQTIEKAIKQVQDRIDKGDYILDKKNKLIRKPMSGKDLMTTGAIAYDKRQIGRNLPTSISTSVDNKALKALQAQFEDLAGKTIEGEIVSETGSK